MDSRNEIKNEDAKQNVTLEWLDDAKIAIITAHGSSRKEAEAWVDISEELIRDWEPDKKFAVMYDAKWVFLSPYVRRRAELITQITKEKALKGRYAVVVSDNVMGQATSIFINFTIRGRVADGLEGQCFTSREVALAWLRE